ncbi:MAG: D-alanyl-D-alanine carboxypeptidase [Steroidobacteraceae bacterium]|jgi:D-alanyl-D-alanine carboxypeptidase (penicillin-binding protein 5/6)|nr:D-alanyl-D-alanine carboxypeptidase [Steroidobacteraceae bacterium]
MPQTARLLPLLVLALFSLTALAAPPPVPAPPTFDARAWILIDAQSGRVITSHDADTPHEPASITKLMTAYAVFQAVRAGKLSLDTAVPISERAWRSEGSRSFVDLNSRVPIEVLLQGVIVQSGNDASIALAEAVAGSEEAFAGLMNEYARRLGMTQSYFENSTGLPGERHRVSARDMGVLGRAIVREFPEYYRWYSQREFTWNNITQRNRNGLLDRDPAVDGMKTGHTSTAGYCLVSSAQRDGMRMIAVVLGTPSVRAREDASMALLNYGLNFFETRRVHPKGTELAMPRILRAPGGKAAVGIADELYVTVPRGRGGDLEVAVEVEPKLRAPIAASQPVGRVTVSLDGEVVAAQPLYPLADVAEGGFFRRLWDTIVGWFT